MNHNDMLFAAQKIIENFVEGPKNKFLAEILTDDASIKLCVNGKTFDRNKAEFMVNFDEAYSENIEKIDILKVACEVTSPCTVKVMETSLHHRRGVGLEESGAGLYHIEDTGHYTFVNEGDVLKVSRLEHVYTKTRTQPQANAG